MVKQSHRSCQDQIKPGRRIGKPGRKKGQHQICGKLCIQQIAKRISHLSEFHHQNIGNGTQDAGKKQHTDPAKIIISIVKKREGCELRFIYINRKMDQLREEKFQS